jgi:hypothetical protein
VREVSPDPEERQAKRPCSRSQIEREALDLRNRLERSRTFKRETGQMSFRADRLGPPVRTEQDRATRDDYWSPFNTGAERRRRCDCRSPSRGPNRGRRAPSLGRGRKSRSGSRPRKRQLDNNLGRDASPKNERGRKRARSVERGGGAQARPPATLTH